MNETGSGSSPMTSLGISVYPSCSTSASWLWKRYETITALNGMKSSRLLNLFS